MRRLVEDAEKAARFLEDGGQTETTIVLILQPGRDLATGSP